MSNAALQVKISADVDELKAAFATANKSLEDFKNGSLEAFKKGDIKGAAMQGAQGLGALAGSVQTLSVAILSNPIGLMVAVLGGLVAATASAVSKAEAAQIAFANEADALDKLAAKTGMAASELQVYGGLAKLTNTDVQSLGMAVSFLQRQIAGEGDSPTDNWLERLGVEATETGPALVEAAQKIEDLGTDAEKTAARMGIFGRGGQEIAGFLSKIAELGPAAGDMLKSLVKTQDDASLAVGAQVEALGKLSELISSGKDNALAAKTIEARKEAELASVAYDTLGGMVTTWKEFVVLASNEWNKFKTRVIETNLDLRGDWKDTTNFFTAAWDKAVAKFGQTWNSATDLFYTGMAKINAALGRTDVADGFKQLAQQAEVRSAAARQQVDNASMRMVDAIDGAAKAELKARFNAAKLTANTLTSGGAKPKGTGTLGAKRGEKDTSGKDKEKQIADAQYALEKASLEAAQRLQDDSLKQAQKAYDEAYKDGLIALDGYYTARETIERTRLAGIVATREKELQEAKKREAVALKVRDVPGQLRAKAEVVKLEAEVQLAKNNLERLAPEIARLKREAQKELDSATLKINIELQQLQGTDTSRAQILATLREQYKDVFAKFAQDPAMTEKLEKIVLLKADTSEFEQSLKKAELAQRQQSEPLEQRSAAIKAKVDTGQISGPRAQGMLDGIKAEQLQRTQQYIAQLQELRAGLDQGEQSAAKLQQALELDAKINGLKINVESLKPTVVDLGVTFENSLAANAEQAFGAMLNGTKSASQAFGDMAKSIIADIAKMIAKMLIMKAIKALTGFADGGAVGGAGSGGLGAIFAADGGPIRGPGGPRDDVIPAYLSNGEHVMDARTVGMFGHGFFNALRAAGNQRGGSQLQSTLGSAMAKLGTMRGQAPSPGRLKFADGGPVAALAGTAGTAGNMARGSGAMTLVQHFHVPPATDTRSQSQTAAAAYMGAQRAQARNG